MWLDVWAEDCPEPVTQQPGGHLRISPPDVNNGLVRGRSCLDNGVLPLWRQKLD